MSKKVERLPTAAELKILKVLWEAGPSTVREIHEIHKKEKTVRYTTVLRLLQNMHDKNFVRRDDSERSHIFSANLTEEETQTKLLRDLAERVFSGSTKQLVLRALSTSRASKAELAEIRELLAESTHESG